MGVYRRGHKFYASSDLDLSWPTLRGLYRIRSTTEETFKVLKCGWQGVRTAHSGYAANLAYRRPLTLRLRAFVCLDQQESRRETTPYKLRRPLISGKLVLDPAALEHFLTAAQLQLS